MRETIDVAVVDNDPWSARAIAQWISNRDAGFRVVWRTTSAAEAVHRCLYSGQSPDVLVLDMALGGTSGSSVCAKIRQRSATPGIIGITAYDPARYADELAAAGA